METTTLDSPVQNSPKYFDYAGFWLRFVALFIDGILLSIVQWIVILPIMGLIGFGSADMMDPDAMASGDMDGMFGMLTGVSIFINLISTVLVWLYFALMESGNNQATLGKMALGLKVTDMHGEKLSFANATGRYFAKIISYIILLIGFIMAAFTEKKQALHDMIAGTLVVKK
ncbi:RDD family protein [Fulvivirga maritima]|uniref:RDD family protein n=1 Tax=Fulvivirga maritima TaxID=2904247 RepID=UPI001F16FC59|nr:RDD family protein [Fulvivirga maritima]UII28371.1 RDD family protein [Fulvivirga maritima]